MLKPFQSLEVVMVLRKCRVCGAHKPLEHYVCGNNCRHKHDHNQKACAACRGGGRRRECGL